MNLESLPSLGPKGSRLLGFLVDAIARKPIKKGEPETFVTYAEALRGMGIEEIWHAGRQLNLEGLQELNGWTMGIPELPKIAALIVNQDTRRPSAPFATSYDWEASEDWEHWWLEEAAKSIEFDWSRYLKGTAPEPEAVASALHQEGDFDYRKIITIDPGKRGGRPCIRRMRITVGDVLGWLAAGMSYIEIMDDFPELTELDIRAALAFAADRERHTASMMALPA